MFIGLAGSCDFEQRSFWACEGRATNPVDCMSENLVSVNKLSNHLNGGAQTR